MKTPRFTILLATVALTAGLVLPVPAIGLGHEPGAQAAKKKRCKAAKKKRKKACKKKRVTAPVGGPAPDLTAPVPPTLTSTDPRSPASGTTPRVFGLAEPTSTVRLFTDSNCLNPVAGGAGTAAELTYTGIAIKVAADSTTDLYATATDTAGNRSGCSSPALTYVEAPVQVESAPALIPAFDPEVSDYVTRCDGTTPVSVSVDAPNAATVDVDGSGPQGGSFTVPVDLEAGQRFPFTIQTPDGVGAYNVRCLPADFPQWTFDRLGQPNNDFYVVDPNLSTGGLVSHYSVIYDEWGVPVWWFGANTATLDSKVLSNGTVAFTKFDGIGAGYELRSLDGALQRTVAAIGGPTDIHDLQELPNGNFLLLQYRQRAHADLTACGLSNDEFVVDAVIEEIDPSGNEVWEWDAKDHIDPTETGRWCDMISGPVYDIDHINSVEPDGDAVVISMRHTDAVYKIDKTTNDIVWKLGGTTTPESLTVQDDPYGSFPFGGQHDARLQPDGTLTVHDNATLLAHAPRAVRYAIDEGAGTATLVETVNDPEVVPSGCCGSARRSPSGSWLMSWGLNELITEFDASGNRTFRLHFPGAVSYRAFPVPPGLLTRSALRSGMDAQFPRP